MEIERVLDDSALPSSDEGVLKLVPGGNRARAIFEDGDYMHAFWYVDENWSDYGSTSPIAVYDSETLREKRVIDVPCPGLNVATRAEDGSTYYSPFDITAGAMLGQQTAPCIAKIGADRMLEDTWDLREWVDGHFAANFRYIGNGKAIANVFLHEAFDVSEIEELDLATLSEALWGTGPHWQLWLLDVETKRGQAIEGIDADLGINGWTSSAVVDGRAFAFLAYDGRTKTYELDPSAGTASEHFDVVGTVTDWLRVR